jgi:hypothetical protein
MHMKFRKLIPAVLLFCIWIAAAFSSEKVYKFLGPWTKAWSAENKTTFIFFLLVVFLYLGVWLASLKIKELDGLWPILTHFPVKATTAWTLYGIISQTLVKAISFPLGDYALRDFDLIVSISGQHLAGLPRTIVGAVDEELTYRGMTLFVLLGIFAGAKHRVLISIFIAAAMFAFGHTTRDPGLFLRVVVFGLLTGAICLRYKSIFPGVGLHAMANATMNLFGGDDVRGGIFLSYNGPHLIVDTILYALVFCLMARKLVARRHCAPNR